MSGKQAQLVLGTRRYCPAHSVACHPVQGTSADRSTFGEPLGGRKQMLQQDNSAHTSGSAMSTAGSPCVTEMTVWFLADEILN